MCELFGYGAESQKVSRSESRAPSDASGERGGSDMRNRAGVRCALMVGRGTAGGMTPEDSDNRGPL